MAQSNPWQSYRQVATKTASPGQLILMLYEGAVRFLEQGRTGFGLEDPLESNQTVHNNLQKAISIINELNYSLNMEAGGEFAARMRGLYGYMERTLYEANRSKTQAGVDDVLKRLEVLRDAWKEMLQSKGAEMAPLTSLTALG